ASSAYWRPGLFLCHKEEAKEGSHVMTEVREANSELQKSVTTQLSLCHPERSEGEGSRRFFAEFTL
ncbi:MAG: hypothetical protein CO103_01605, partial [Chloroflexi bacterium CG_4_9_14_3_um_filter_45_9]